MDLMQNLIRQRDALLKRLVAGGNFVKGSISRVCGTCARSRCICAKACATKAFRLTYKDAQQKTHIVYIPRSRLAEMKRLIANHARVRTTLQQVIDTNIAIFKAGG
ncbi:MAG: hypothetical protein BWK77_08215 [Verrucomicrobia bacterium A1]|nr:MAG: hypothetical protein BWK77_08215 [Verrucomicrobia bacterium A1]